MFHTAGMAGTETLKPGCYKELGRGQHDVVEEGEGSGRTLDWGATGQEWQIM